jgi:hypothetical protein
MFFIAADGAQHIIDHKRIGPNATRGLKEKKVCGSRLHPHHALGASPSIVASTLSVA